LKDGKKVVITYGTFDLFHIGHLRLLQRAKQFGDWLIVGVSTDEFNRIKGKHAIIPYEQRAEIVANIKCVDQVIPEESWDQKVEDVKKYGVDVLVMGDDWKGKFDYLKDYGVEVVYLPRTKGISTTKIKKILAAASRVPVQKLDEALKVLSQIDFATLREAFDILEELAKEFSD
jgi:glycerol-3-phosphate cytidylyltransferase